MKTVIPNGWRALSRSTMIVASTIIAAVSLSAFDIMNSTGRAGYSGAPTTTGAAGTNCQSCHSGAALNQGGGTLTITAANMPNWKYVPGQTYQITATVAQSTSQKFGIGVEAIQTNFTDGGTLVAGTNTKILTANSRKNIVHTGTGNTTGVFTFSWTAPATNIGNITFYVAGNATNSSNSFTGDNIYTTSQVMTPAAPLPVTILAGSTTVCAGKCTTLTARVTNGTANYTYAWSGATPTPTGATLTVCPTATTTYAVTATDPATGNTGTATQVVTVSPFTPAVITQQGSLCSPNGVFLSASGGVSYVWSNQATSAGTVVNTAATYTVTATNAAGCTATASVTVTQPTPPAITLTGTAAFCTGKTTSIVASSTAGAVSPTFQWSNQTGAGPTTVVGTAGTYTVTTTSADGCTSTKTIAVTQNAPPIPVISGVLSFCAGGSTLLTASGGTSYLWSGQVTTPTLTVSAAGTYFVNVTNQAGCSASTGVAVTQSSAPTASITQQGTLCSPNGVTLTGSTTGTSFAWSNGAMTPSINVNMAGTYTVTVANSSGCTATGTTVLAPCAPLQVTVTPSTATICGPNSCASVAATVAGTATATYNWGTVLGTGATKTICNAGTYTVTATASTGATGTASVVIINGAITPFTLSNYTLTCANPNTDICAPSGFSSYVWSSGGIGTTNCAFANAVGTYIVTVTNASGCTATASSVVTGSTTQPQVGLTANITQLTCTANSAILTATGGGSYTWSPNVVSLSSNTAQATSAGIYTVTVTGTNGCSLSKTITITQNITPPTAVITASNTVLTCASPSTVLTATGGGSYVWSTQATTPSITVTSSGIYTATVIGTNGCTATAIITIAQNTTLPTAAISSGGNLTCSRTSTNLTATGGGSYVWSNSASGSATITVQTGGIYTVTVTNSTGCTATATIRVEQNTTPPNIAVTASSVNCTLPITLTALSITTVPNLTFVWSTQATTATISVTAAGTYSVTATDIGTGCTTVKSITVTAPTAVTAAISGAPTNAICNGSAAQLLASGGSVYAWSNGVATPNNTVSPAVTTTYIVTVTNSGGCSATKSVTISVNARPTVSILGATTQCPGLTFSFTATGGGAYIWSSGSAGASVSGLAAGTYTVTATGTNGCAASRSVTGAIVNNRSCTTPVSPIGARSANTDSGSESSDFVYNTATENIVLYPNPGETVLNIALQNDDNQSATVRVMDMLGRSIITTKTTDHQLLIDTQNWASGTYLVRIELAGKPYSLKWVKM